MKKNKQLKLLTRGDAKKLQKFKKKTKIKMAEDGLNWSANSASFFDNRILITTEELAVIFHVTPQTIRNWVARRKIPYIQIGRRNLFQKRSLQQWLNQKEEPLWE